MFILFKYTIILTKICLPMQREQEVLQLWVATTLSLYTYVFDNRKLRKHTVFLIKGETILKQIKLNKLARLKTLRASKGL